MKLDKKLLKQIIKESLEEVELKSVSGGGEGSGIATGMLKAAGSARNTLEQNAVKLSEMAKQNEKLMKELEANMAEMRANNERFQREVEEIFEKERQRKKELSEIPPEGPKDINVPD